MEIAAATTFALAWYIIHSTFLYLSQRTFQTAQEKVLNFKRRKETARKASPLSWENSSGPPLTRSLPGPRASRALQLFL